jgi:hypothetical protein
LALALLWLTACSPAASPTDGAAQPFTSTAPPATPAAIASPPATLTSAPPSTQTETQTLTPTPTPTPPVLNPLTGLVVTDPSVLDRRPLAIKVAHFPRRVREHQVGLSYADNVWEHYAEGGVTRFTALFLGQSPEKVGNVRSARLIDAHLGQAYQSMLVASGSSTGTMNRLRENPDLFERVIAEATGYSECPLLCREESADVTTDKLFTSPAALWELAAQLGLNSRQNLEGFAFDPQPPAGGVVATTIHIDFQINNTIAEYRYDPATQTYARWIDTASLPELAPHVDTLNGRQITTSNVVALYVLHVSSNIRETEDGARYFSYDILFTGEGVAKLFRDGMMYDVTWVRPDALSGLPRLVDAGGKVVPFHPGAIWFDVLSTDSPTNFDAERGNFYARFKAPNPFPDTTPTP